MSNHWVRMQNMPDGGIVFLRKLTHFLDSVEQVPPALPCSEDRHPSAGFSLTPTRLGTTACFGPLKKAAAPVGPADRSKLLHLVKEMHALLLHQFSVPLHLLRSGCQARRLYLT